MCSPTHFDSYFRFAVGDEVMSRAELEEFIDRAADRDYLIDTMRRAVSVMCKSGGTKAAVVLSELNIYAEKIAKERVLPLLSAFFSIADEINVEADESRGFSIANNQLRLHWLLRSLILDRMTLAERSEVLLKACEGAALGWLADFTSSAWADYHPREGKAPEPPENCLTTEVDAGRLRGMLLKRIEAAAEGGVLASNRDLTHLLYRWSDLADDDGTAVRAWTEAIYATDFGVKQLAIAFTSFSWSQGLGGLGDLVAKRTTRVHMKGLEKLVDLAAFRKRVEEVAESGSMPEVVEFLDAWRRADQGVRD